MSGSGNHPVAVGITGASGAVIAVRLVDELLSAGVPVIASASPAARMVWRDEIAETFGDTLERWADSGDFTYYPPGDLRAPIASGTFPTRGMAVVPCSMATASAVAHGMSDNLVRRAADVCLKERRPLVLVPRETPMSAVHLENLATLARLGATILPPEPPFYLGLQTLQEVVDFIVQRTLVSLGVADSLPDHFRYKGGESAEA